MITVTPQGSVYLCKTPLENDYKNQLDFTSASAQQSYFSGSSVLKHTYTDFTYIKKDNQIVVGDPIDTIIDCNYLYYKNTGFTTKYYYCFITDMEYVNENATRITFETDVYQTYMFNIVKKACFVEREHVNDDTIGINTVPEGLETGEFVINSAGTIIENLTLCNIYIGVTKHCEGLPGTFYGNDYGGIYSGVTYFMFDLISDAGNFIKAYDGMGLGDNIQAIFLLPKAIYNPSSSSKDHWLLYYGDSYTYSVDGYTVTQDNLPINMGTTSLGINSKLNGYTPKNNKMFTGEYNYLYVTNNAGSDVTYFYEDFIDHTPEFKCEGSITVGGSIKLYPQKYKLFNCTPTLQNSFTGVEEYNYGITCGKYPTCSWSNDSYTNWLTQNSINFDLKTEMAGAQMISSFGNMASGDVLGTVEGLAGGIGNIANVMIQKKLHSYSPNQSKGSLNAGDITYTTGAIGFTFQRMSCRYEFAKRIDDFFSMFGYKVNEVKIPNLTGRTYWNYVKTIDCNFEGDIPQVYLNKIKNIFNSGITIWHNASHFLDYSQNNTIVTP